jgi:aspartyl-tRNA(Asn)/glutamyl-tRNA(Gln) amidotransferase subunit B
LQTLHQVRLYPGSSTGNMEEGSLRCDANVSVRKRGETRLGTKTEVKNVNSFRNVGRAIEFEISRQIELLEAGGRVVQETRSFDADTGKTRLMRSKEEAHDYRYFPDPDLPPLVVVAERIEDLRGQLPELPWQRRSRLVEQLGLPVADALVLTGERALADYYEAVVAAHPSNAKAAANWVMVEVLRVLKERKAEVADALPPARLAALVALVDAGKLSSSAAKEVFTAIWDSGEEPAAAMDRLGLGQVSDTSQIEAWIDEVIRGYPSQVEQFRGGKEQILGFLVGQVMKRSGGRAEPKSVQQLLRQALEREPAPSA